MLEIFEKLESSTETEQEVPREYGIDFETGQLTGKIVTGADALMVWAFFALRIQRYRFRQFTWAYGSQTEELIGKNYGIDFEKSELKRYITDCLLVHPMITGVSDFETDFSGSRLTARFRIETDYGARSMTFSEEAG